MAVACATVNSMIWGLGMDILFYAGNTLTEDWKTAAANQRDELRRIAADVERYRALLDGPSPDRESLSPDSDST